MSTDLVIRRFIPVARERVFAAWLDAAGMSEWMCAGDGTATADIDPRVGGKFRIAMTHGSRRTEHTGEYLAIEPPSLVSFTWRSAYTDDESTIVTVELVESGGGTELTLTHRRLPPARIDAHRDGWTDILRKLDAALSR